jgi:hypothetical protein
LLIVIVAPVMEEERIRPVGETTISSAKLSTCVLVVRTCTWYGRPDSGVPVPEGDGVPEMPVLGDWVADALTLAVAEGDAPDDSVPVADGVCEGVPGAVASTHSAWPLEPHGTLRKTL